MKFILSITFMVLTFFFAANAQTEIHTFFDVGENNASEGMFVKNGYRGSLLIYKFKVEAGVQFDYLSNNPNTFSGFDILGTKEFAIKDFPVNAKGFFMLNRFSDILCETNWGVRFETRKLKYFRFEFGTNFKTYAINRASRAKYNIDSFNKKQQENFNLVYGISAYLKPVENNWNVVLCITNLDYYVINQATNPVFNLQTSFNVKSDLTLYLESWYKQAGVFNINANYFGYFFRVGVKWKI